MRKLLSLFAVCLLALCFVGQGEVVAAADSGPPAQFAILVTPTAIAPAQANMCEYSNDTMTSRNAGCAGLIAGAACFADGNIYDPKDFPLRR